MSKKKAHPHCYYALSNGTTFRCSKPGCTTIINNKENMLGRLAECPYCNQTYYIEDEHLRRKTLHCLGCTIRGVPKDKPTKEVVQTEDIFAELIKTRETPTV